MKAELTPVEREEAQKYAWTESAFRAVNQRIGASSELKADTAFHDMSQIFVAQKSLVFIDYCHITETANEQIADQIAANLADMK